MTAVVIRYETATKSTEIAADSDWTSAGRLGPSSVNFPDFDHRMPTANKRRESESSGPAALAPYSRLLTIPTIVHTTPFCIHVTANTSARRHRWETRPVPPQPHRHRHPSAASTGCSRTASDGGYPPGRRRAKAKTVAPHDLGFACISRLTIRPLPACPSVSLTQ